MAVMLYLSAMPVMLYLSVMPVLGFKQSFQFSSLRVYVYNHVRM